MLDKNIFWYLLIPFKRKAFPLFISYIVVLRSSLGLFTVFIYFHTLITCGINETRSAPIKNVYNFTASINNNFFGRNRLIRYTLPLNDQNACEALFRAFCVVWGASISAGTIFLSQIFIKTERLACQLSIFSSSILYIVKLLRLSAP